MKWGRDKKRKASLGHWGSNRKKMLGWRTVSIHSTPPTLPGTQAKIQTSKREEQLQVRAQIRLTGKHSYLVNLNVRPEVHNTFSLKENAPKKMIHKQYKLQALKQYFLLLLANLTEQESDIFFHCTKATLLSPSGLISKSKVFLLILEFSRWTTGTPFPATEPGQSSPLFLSNTLALQKVGKNYLSIKDFTKGKTKAFQLAFPGFQTVAFCFLRLAKINLKKQTKRNSSLFLLA